MQTAEWTHSMIHNVTTDPHTEQYISRSKYGFGGGDFNGNFCYE